MLRFVAILTLAGCITNPLVPCGDNLCPSDSVCTIGGCASPEAATACRELKDGEACTTTAIATGECYGGACLAIACGNGVMQMGEICDDGNQSANDGCSSDCQSDETCGNGIIDVAKGEDCDEGVPGLAGDGCSSTCQDEVELWVSTTILGRGAAARMPMVWDSTRKVIVAWGYITAGAALSGTVWEWNGAQWTNRTSVGTSPIGRAGGVATYDDVHKRSIFGLGGSTSKDLWAWQDGSWLRLPDAPVGGPGNSLAWDSLRSRLVFVENATGKTWESDGTVPGTWATAPTASGLANASLVYDNTVHKVVRFGGTMNGVPSNDTFEYSGTAWTLVLSTDRPPAQAGAALAYSATAGGVYLLDSALSNATTWLRTGGQWRQVGTDVLAQTQGAALAYDEERHELLRFGGCKIDSDVCVPGDSANTMSRNTGTQWLSVDTRRIPDKSIAAAFDPDVGAAFVIDTLGWMWQLTAAQISNATLREPTTRWTYPTLAYDPTHHELVSFGGAAGDTFTNVTRVWSGTAWQMRAPETSPSVRRQAAMAPDAAGGLVMFGGRDDSSVLDDTWRWNGTTWEELAVAGPPGRWWASMTYDSARHVTVLFGGYDADAMALGDTWEWDGTTWLARPTAKAPLARGESNLAYDPLRRVTVLSGGTVGGQRAFDTWEWDGTTWTDRSGFYAAPARMGGAAQFDPRQRKLVEVSESTFVTREFRTTDRVQELCDGTDADGDLRVDCEDPDCWATCTPDCPPGTSCP